jgi:hypothetical protein
MYCNLVALLLLLDESIHIVKKVYLNLYNCVGDPLTKKKKLKMVMDHGVGAAWD